jgi:hypothetical protein
MSDNIRTNKVIRGLVDRHKKKIKELTEAIKTLQGACHHEGASKVYKGDTGNWCPSDNHYWIEFKCPHCDKFWTENQ